MRAVIVQSSGRWLMRVSWSMFSDHKHVLFSLNISSFLPVHGHSCVIIARGEMSKLAVAPDWGKGKSANNYRLHLYCLTYSPALALALRTPLTQTDRPVVLSCSLYQCVHTQMIVS